MKRTFRLPKEEPLLDIASYARGGPRAAGRLTPAEIEHIRLTVNRAPEVVVKVLPKGSSDLKAVGKHIDYIGRRGNLEIESDDGERLKGRIGAEMLQDWDLDLDDVRRQASLTAASKRTPPRIAHKLMFSMPPGTPPQKVLTAVRNFAREEFYGQHRYAMVLHTDEPHPHVHLLLKAVSEQGERLNIKKATLRHWRSQFASQLRGLGVVANATERAVRGEGRSARKDGIYRASLRGDSTYLRAQAEAIAREMSGGAHCQERGLRYGGGRAKIVATRAAIQAGWKDVADRVLAHGDSQLATDIVRFVGGQGQPITDKQRLAQTIMDATQTIPTQVRAR